MIIITIILITLIMMIIMMIIIMIITTIILQGGREPAEARPWDEARRMEQLLSLLPTFNQALRWGKHNHKQTHERNNMITNSDKHIHDINNTYKLYTYNKSTRRWGASCPAPGLPRCGR